MSVFLSDSSNSSILILWRMPGVLPPLQYLSFKGFVKQPLEILVFLVTTVTARRNELTYSPPSVDRIWLWIYQNKIPIYPLFSLLKGDYMPSASLHVWEATARPVGAT